MSDTMATKSLPFIYKTPDRPIKKVVPNAPERPSNKIDKLPKLGYVNKFIEKINNDKIYNEENEWKTVEASFSPTLQNEWKIVESRRKKHYIYPKYSKAYTPQASGGYNEYLKEKHYCGDYDCAGDCGVLWCGCIDVCRKRCGGDF